jgi:hypothetical protein
MTSSNYLNLLHLPYVMAFRLASNGNSIACKQAQSMTRKAADVDVLKATIYLHASRQCQP